MNNKKTKLYYKLQSIGMFAFAGAIFLNFCVKNKETLGLFFCSICIIILSILIIKVVVSLLNKNINVGSTKEKFYMLSFAAVDVP